MASVIKAGHVIPSGTPVQHIQYNLENMDQAASHYLDAVRKKAAEILQEAKSQAEKIRTQAAYEGRRDAEEKARTAALADVEARWKTLSPALKQAIDSAAELKTIWIRQWEKNILRLVGAVAERVIRREMASEPQISQQWIREALDLASGSTTVTLLLNPTDYDALDDYRDSLKQQFSQLADANIVPHPDISPGGCRVVTDYGQLDQQLETQISRIEEELTS